MGRYADYSDDDSGIPPEFWDHNVRAALKGKRGQQMLRELRAALDALPERRLIQGAMCTVGGDQRKAAHPHGWLGAELDASIAENDGEGVCAIGAWLWHKRVLAGMDPAEAFASLPELLDDAISETARLATGAGASFTLAWSLAEMNDQGWRALTPEARWQAFADWIDEQLAVSA